VCACGCVLCTVPWVPINVDHRSLRRRKTECGIKSQCGGDSGWCSPKTNHGRKSNEGRRPARTQHSSPAPFRPLSVQVFKLNPARVSWPITTAISRMASLSNMAAHDGPDGNEVEQRPSDVQFENIDEWMQLCPLQPNTFVRVETLLFSDVEDAPKKRVHAVMTAIQLLVIEFEA
jgi:hypothetical protein